ncbi:MAG: hypothetical protein ACJAS9_001942 [Polaribacter sp.]|jgi:hypothetical protein
MNQRDNFFRRITFQFFILIISFSLFSCSQYQIADSPKIKKSRTWIIMPLENNSNQPLATEKVEAILSATLFSYGVDAQMYPKTIATDLVSILDNQSRKLQASDWLIAQEATYVISGSVNEWHYKSGLDGEPAVGITLELIDKVSKTVLWKATGSRSGWGRESLTGAGQTVIEELIDGLEIPEKED